MQPGRNDPCSCGSGRKFKHCCRRANLPIAPVLSDIRLRQAEYWRPLPGQSVACDLCYRRCEIDEGAAGWCKTRRNDGGRLVLDGNGVLVSMGKKHNGYAGNGFYTYKPGQRGVMFGHTHCTAGCTFCLTAQTSWKPEAIPWALEEEGLGNGENFLMPGGNWWSQRRALYTPAQVVDNALQAGAGNIEIGINEPTLFIEYTMDVARLAKRHGLDVLLDSNGFTEPAAIRELAPYVDAVLFGIKGSADPVFYDRHMRSSGAVPHVLEAARIWKECGVYLILSDVIAPLHMQSDEAAAEAQKRLYGWIADEIGERNPVILPPMVRPQLISTGPASGDTSADRKERPEGNYLLPRGGEDWEAKEAAYLTRLLSAIYAATAAGLRYVCYGSTISCHSCGSALLQRRSPMLNCRPCTLPFHHCTFWTHEEHVTPAGRCKGCGAQTPIVTMSPEERRRHDAWRATADPGESIRTRVEE